MEIFEVNGKWQKKELNSKIQLLKKIEKTDSEKIVFDFKNLEKADSAGIILIIKYLQIFQEQNKTVCVENISKKHQKMLDFYGGHYQATIPPKVKKANIFYNFTHFIIDYFHSSLHFLNYIGKAFFYFVYMLFHPRMIRFKAIVREIEISGIKILPIVAMTTFLVGFVTAYQGALQLGKFGADAMVIEMATMSIFRELAPFLAAVVVAGRSASSYTAQIGAMKITDEVDAMKTMGFSPDIFLIIPRMIALVIIMPLIVFFADMMALLGEMVVIKMHLGIGYGAFLDRIYEFVELRHFLLGICKAPLFGIIIALIGCYRGLQVRGSTTSIGKFTTKSVVDTIFWLIIVNALISLLSVVLGF